MFGGILLSASTSEARKPDRTYTGHEAYGRNGASGFGNKFGTKQRK
jgi:hypothetical protein